MLFDNRVNNVADALSTASACSQKRTADFVNFVNIVRIKHDCVVAVFFEKSLVAELEAVNRMHAVAFPQTAHNRPNHVVEAGAKSAASADSRVDFFRVEINFFARTCFLQKIRHGQIVRLAFVENFYIVADKRIVLDIIRFVVAHHVGKFNRRIELAFSKFFYCNIEFLF